MAKHCLRCGYNTPDLWADECPFCLVTLARVRPGGPDPIPAPARSSRAWPVKLLIPLGLFLGAVLLAFATGMHVLVTDEFALGPMTDADSTGRVRVGMTADEVARTLDMDDPGEARFTGRIVRQRQGRLLRVRFNDGRVTGVEEGRPIGPLSRTDRAETHYHN